jgi:hypothetical protein
VELFRSFVQKIQPLLEDAAFRTDLQSLASVDGALNAHVMKWPHHAWLPRSAKGRQTLKDFIQAVNPEVIVFSTSPETSEIRFQASEFSNAEAFVARLKSGADPLSTWLITRFSEGTRASVSSYDGGGVNRDLKQALATELTGLMRGPLIYRSDLFAGYDLEDLQPQLAAGVSEAMRPALNRELLERAYPELGQISGQNVERVKKFLREMFPYRHFTFVITGSDGDVKVLSLNDLQQHERQDSNSSVSLAR